MIQPLGCNRKGFKLVISELSGLALGAYGGSNGVPVYRMAKPWHVVQQSLYETSRSILNAVRDGVPAATGILGSLKSYAVVEATYAAAASGEPEVPPKWLNHGATA